MTAKSLSLMIVLMAAVFFTALSVVYSQHKKRQLFISMQSLVKNTDALNTDYDRLLLERGAMASYNIVEKRAVEELNMQAPDVGKLKFFILGGE